MSLQPGRSLSSLVTVTLASVVVVVGAVAAHASTGTTAAPARTTTPAASPTVTTATTATIDRPTAYWFCRATVYRWAFRNPSVAPFTVRTFAKADITSSGSGWRIGLVGSAGERSAWCDVEGTAAHPRLVASRMPR